MRSSQSVDVTNEVSQSVDVTNEVSQWMTDKRVLTAFSQ